MDADKAKKLVKGFSGYAVIRGYMGTVSPVTPGEVIQMLQMERRAVTKALSNMANTEGLNVARVGERYTIFSPLASEVDMYREYARQLKAPDPDAQPESWESLDLDVAIEDALTELGAIGNDVELGQKIEQISKVLRSHKVVFDKAVGLKPTLTQMRWAGRIIEHPLQKFTRVMGPIAINDPDQHEVIEIHGEGIFTEAEREAMVYGHGAPGVALSAPEGDPPYVNLILTSVGPKMIQVVKVVREEAHIGLREAVRLCHDVRGTQIGNLGRVDDYVNGTPQIVLEKVSLPVANRTKLLLEALGATVDIQGISSIDVTEYPADEPIQSRGLEQYKIWLRKDIVAVLEIPVDLTHKEANRLIHYITTLVFD